MAIGAVNIAIGASTNDFERALNAASSAVGEFRNNFKTAFEGLKGSAEAPKYAFGAVGRELKKAEQEMKNLVIVGGAVPDELRRKYEALRATVQTVNGAFRQTKDSQSGSGGLLGSVTSLAAGYFSLTAAIGGVKKALSITSDYQRLDTALKAVSTSTADYNNSQQLLLGTADRLGLSYQALAQSFKGIKAATNGTALEGKEAEKIFLSVVRASAALQLTSDETKGALLALQQMISKGTVSAEELRGQLGERLPGAFRLFAESMGVSEQKLGKMLENGEVMAVDVLPKFAQKLEETFGAQAQANVDTMGGGFQRLTDQAGLLVAAFSETAGVTGFFASVTNGLADTLSGLRQAIASKEWLTFFGALSGSATGDRLRQGFAVQKENAAKVDEFKNFTPGQRVARLQLLAEEYQRVNKELEKRSDTVLGGGVVELKQQKQALESLYSDLVKVNFELSKSSKTPVLGKSTGGATEFEQSKKRLRELEAQIKNFKFKGLAVPDDVQKSYDTLKAKIGSLDTAFKSIKPKKLVLLDINDVAIYQRQLDKVEKSAVETPNRLETIQNLRQLIKEAKALESGKRLLFEVPDVKSKGVSTSPGLPGLDEFKQSSASVSYSASDQQARYKKAVDAINKAYTPEAAKGAVKRFNDLLGQGMNFDEAIDKVAGEGEKLKQALSSALSGAAQAGFVGMGELIGGMLAGTAKLADIPKMLGAVFGDLAKSMGKAMIAFGTAGIAAKAFVSNPVTAIAGGIALTALGTALTASMQKSYGSVAPFANGGLVFGPTLGLVGEGIGTTRRNPEVIAPLDHLQSMLGGGSQVFIPSMTLRGQDIVIAYERSKITMQDWGNYGY